MSRNSMVTMAFTGTVFSVDVQPHAGPNGEQGKRTVLKFKIRQSRKDQNGTWINVTNWCSAIAFGPAAEIWANFKADDVIQGVGVPWVSPYINRESGEATYSIDMRGVNGITPMIESVLEPYQPAEGGNGGGTPPASPSKYRKPKTDEEDDFFN